MKILLCHNFYQQPGGEDQVFADEGWLLESHAHEVLRYTRHNDEVEGMDRWRLLQKTFWNPETYRQVRELLRRRRPAVLHCHNHFPLISPSIYYAARAEGVPVVQSLHNYRLFCPAGALLRKGRACQMCLRRHVAWPAVVHACYRQSRAASAAVAGMTAVHRALGTWKGMVQRYIALSEFSRRTFVEGGLPPDRIVAKPNFSRVDPGPGSGAGGYAVFVGRLSEEKGLSTLLAAWRRLALPVPLRIAGDGPLAPQVAAAAQADSRILPLGQRPSAEVPAILGSAACAVVPSLCYENCPRVVVEAYACGTPVIAARQGAMAEMVDDRRCGRLFEPGDPADLAAKVAEFWATLPVPAFRAAAREEYQSKYTAERNYAMLMAVYQQALEASHVA